MKVLVINPPNIPFTNHSLLEPPLDVLNVATLIETTFPVKFLDMDALRIKTIEENILQDIDVIIVMIDYQIPLHTKEAFEYLLEMIKMYDKKFIIIGKSPTYFSEKVMKSGAFILIKGIYDEILLPVLKHFDDIESLKKIPNLIINDNRKIIFTKREYCLGNYKNTKIPDYSLVDWNLYIDTATMITSRGCDGTCKFCSTPYFFHSFQAREVISIVDEIELLVKKYNKKKILFLDDNMTVSKERMLKLCTELKKRKLKVLMGCLSSIKHYDKELFEIMYEVGFRWVHFGIESGSKEILKRMGKEMDISYIKKVIKEVKKMGYRVRTSFILDYPGSKVEDFDQTKDLILDLKPHEIRFHFLAYRPGTPVTMEYPDMPISQYIHKPISEQNLSYRNDILLFLKKLEQLGYLVMMEDTEWNSFSNLSKEQKFVSMVPMKYGMCWYE